MKKTILMVGPSCIPTAEQYRKSFEKSVVGFECSVLCDEQNSNVEEIDLVTGLQRITMRTSTIMKEHADIELAAYTYASFTMFEVEGVPKPLMFPVVFIPMRNRRGAEWIYTHFVGRVLIAKPLLEALSDMVIGVLRARSDFSYEPLPEENELSDAFLMRIKAGIEHAVMQPA
jgi:hypothetical protein